VAAVACAPERGCETSGREGRGDALGHELPDGRGVSSAAIVPDDQQLARAVERGEAFLRTHPPDPVTLLALDYLERKYGLPGDLSFEAMRAGQPEPGVFPVFARIAGDRRPVDPESFASLVSTDWALAYALHCDELPLPPDYEGRLRKLTDAGNYDATHALLALKLLRDNGCEARVPGAGVLEARLRSILRTLAATAAPDLRSEAAAMSEDLLGERDGEGATVRWLLATQRRDGGWAPSEPGPSNPHTSLVAVWVLLGWAHPDAPRVSFARR
jgi:hypothetical protein